MWKQQYHCAVAAQKMNSFLSTYSVHYTHYLYFYFCCKSATTAILIDNQRITSDSNVAAMAANHEFNTKLTLQASLLWLKRIAMEPQMVKMVSITIDKLQKNKPCFDVKQGLRL
jgi:hypothetical protein